MFRQLGLGMLTSTWLWLSLSVVRADQNVIVLLDDSGSMQERMGRGSMRKIDAAKEALLTVLEQVSDDANVAVLLLNGPSGGGDWLIKLGPLDRAQLEDSVRRIDSEHGTPLGQFMKIAAETGTDMIFMLESFCGHGFNHNNPANECYKPGNERWFDDTCIHPNPTGHHAIADMFMKVVDE